MVQGRGNNSKKDKGRKVCFTWMVREGQFEAGKLEQRPACMEGGSRGAPQRRQVWGPVQRRVQIQGYMSPKPVLSLLPHHAAPRGLATAVLETWKQFPVLESVALWDLCPLHIKTEPISPPWSCPHAVSYTHLTLPTTRTSCRSRWSPYH